MERRRFSNDEEYLALWAKYEYFKRNSAGKAFDNINKMIKKENPEAPVRRNKRRAADSNGALRVAKLQKLMEEKELQDPVEDVENVPKVVTKGKSPSMDSDTSEVDRQSPDAPRIEGAYQLVKVQDLYKKMVKDEVFDILIDANNRRQDLSGDDVLQLLSISRAILSLPTLQNLLPLPHIDKLLVTISFYGITLEFYNSKLKSWSKSVYWKHPQGTLVWHEDQVFLRKNIKYQNLASLDFQYLVGHSNAQLEELEFRIEKYLPWNLKMAPFDKFFGKIRNLFTLQKVHVKKWSMEYFNHEDDTSRGPKVVMSVWSILNEEVLESIKIRKWNDTHLEKRFVTKENWEIWRNLNNVKHLDVDDSVKMDSFERLRSLRTVQMDLQESGFVDFIETFNAHPPARFEVYPGPHFDFYTAKQLIQFEQQFLKSYCLPAGLMIRFDENRKEKRIVFMRRDSSCAR
ncbi:unnamed protein product [Caenorhabditis brenneri]